MTVCITSLRAIRNLFAESVLWLVIAIAGLRNYSAWNLVRRGNNEIISIFVGETPTKTPTDATSFDSITGGGLPRGRTTQLRAQSEKQMRYPVLNRKIQ